MSRKQPKSSEQPSETKTTYMLEMKHGEPKKVTVPSHWHVTFGPIAPTLKATDGPATSTGGVCLRFYDGEVQKACFVNVSEFRVQGEMEVEERHVVRHEEVLQRNDFMGGEAFVARAERYEWRNPDVLRVPDRDGPKQLQGLAEQAANRAFTPNKDG